MEHESKTSLFIHNNQLLIFNCSFDTVLLGHVLFRLTELFKP